MSVFFFSSRRRHTRLQGDWSSDVCSSDLQGHPDYISRAVWFALPGVKARDIDKDSFGGVKNPVIFDSMGKFYVNHMVGVTRLNGIQPPDPYLRADGKKGENKPAQSGPVGKATSKPVEVKGGDSGKKDEPQKKEEPPKKVEKAEPGPPQDFQKDVEGALQILWNARWIKSNPGDSSSVNDKESQAAIKEYQQKFMNGKAPHLGHADTETRRRLLRAAGFAASMPIVNVSLRVLHEQKLISTAPGDNPIQLDDATRASVKDFQRKKGLDPDGIPGQMTQAKLAEAIRGLEKANQPPPAKEEPAIQLFYWVTNNGAAGQPATVKATATAACNGKSFPDGLFATDKVLVENARSEEHTSELQSPCNLVCRLLLEKKKKKTTNEFLGNNILHFTELSKLTSQYIERRLTSADLTPDTS